MSDPQSKFEQDAAKMFGSTTPTRPGEVPGGRGAVPLVYQFTLPPELSHLKLEGQGSEMHEWFSGVARGLGLTNDQANALLHVHVRLLHDPKAPKILEEIK